MISRRFPDPLYQLIVVAGVGLAVLHAGLIIFRLPESGLAAMPFFVPMIHGFAVLETFTIAFLALGRNRAQRDPVSFWVGIAFISYSVANTFYILAWPGLLANGGEIIGHLADTPAWVIMSGQILFASLLIIAGLAHPSGEGSLKGRGWYGSIVGWLVLFLAINGAPFLLEGALPGLVRPDGSYTVLMIILNATVILLYGTGVIISARHYLRSADRLSGYLALDLLLLTSSSVESFMAGQRYAFLWYFCRVVAILGGLILMIGLLWEYVRLYRSEQEKTRQLEDAIGGREQADVALRELNAELEKRVAAQTSDLRMSNEALELHVAARTAEIQSVNKDLKASRLAALNLMEDALESQKLLEQTNERLRVSEARYRSLFNSMTEGFALHEIICDEQGEPCDYRFLDVNPAFEALTGLKREDVLGNTHNQVLPMDSPRWVDEYGKVALTGQSIQFENYSPELKKHYNVHAYRPAAGQFAVIFEDITERIRMESELQKARSEAERRAKELEAVFNSIVDGIIVYTADGHVQQANPAALNMLNLELANGSPANLTESISTRTLDGQGHPLDPTLTPVARALRGLRVDEERFGIKNSEEVETIVFASAVPLWAGDQITGAVEVWHDVSERERLLAQLEDQRQKAEARASELDVVFNSITNGIIVYDTEGRARRTNQAAVEMLGFDPTDDNIPGLVKMLSTRTIDGTPLDPAQGPSVRALRGETVVGERIILQSPLGDDTIVLASASPLWVGDRIAGAVSAWQDVTQQYKAEETQAWLASFPELNPNPIIEFNETGRIYYLNPVARELFPDLEARGNEHAWLNGLETVLEEFRHGKSQTITREVQVGESYYLQSVSFVTPNRRVRIYAFDISKRKQAEAQLELERGNLQMIFDAVNVGLLLIDEGGAIKRSNNVVAQWTDKDFSELINLQPGDALSCIHALSDPAGCGHTPFCNNCRIRQTFESVLKTGQPVHNIEVETTLHLRDEPVRLWLDISADPIAVDGKKHVILALSNITAMKEAEQALRQARDELEVRVQERTHELADSNALLLAEIAERKQAETQLRLQTSAMEAAANGIIITDNQGTIQWCNSAFAQVSGYECEEVIGLNPRFLKSGHHDRSFYDQMWQSLLDGQVWRGEMVNRRKDGSLYNEEQVITPVRDEQNQVTHFIAVKQDISARKQAEEALRLANAYNRSLLEASLDPLATITPDGKIGDVNSATEKVTGRKRDELIGTDFHSYFSDPEKARLGYQKVFEGGSVRDYELEIRHSDGHITPVLYNASVYRDEAGHARGVFTVARDITDRKQFEAQLVQAEKHAVIGRMVGSVTHEINNPLQTIKNCLYLIQQDTPADSPIQEPLDMASSETARLTDLVGQLRELYRPRTDLQDHPHELLDIIEEIHALLTPHLNNSRVRWEPLTGLTRCYINCVRDQILEVFLNISMNAIEAMQNSGGTLSVDMKLTDEQVGVLFKDSGPGISAEIMDHIFEPFQTTKSSGLGLGLSISYGIIQRHGGQIVVENGPESGASFTVWLPVARKSKQEKKKNGA